MFAFDMIFSYMVSIASTPEGKAGFAKLFEEGEDKTLEKLSNVLSENCISTGIENPNMCDCYRPYQARNS
jgi:hypothetical protein